MIKKFTICFMIILLFLLTFSTFAATEWPTKPITLVIGYSEGGGSDTLCRALGREMEDYLDCDIQVINRSGAGASIAAQYVAARPANGYNLFGAVAHSPAAWRVLGYSSLNWTDFYSFNAVTCQWAWVVKKDSEWDTAEDLFTALQNNPGKYKWGSAGLGSIMNLYGSYMLSQFDVDAVHIGYNGGREAATKLMAGEIDFLPLAMMDGGDLIKAGEVKALGIDADEALVLDSQKIPSLRKIYPDVDWLGNLSYWGFRVKRQTPEEIVVKLGKAFEYAVEQDRVKKIVKERDAILMPSVGHESDLLCAKLESLYAWGLYDLNMLDEGVSPANFDIPRLDNFEWPPYKTAAELNPWPDYFNK